MIPIFEPLEFQSHSEGLEESPFDSGAFDRGQIKRRLVRRKAVRTRTRTNTNPNSTEANAAGRSLSAFVARESKFAVLVLFCNGTPCFASQVPSSVHFQSGHQPHEGD
jgi:hypothetical protein